MPEHSTNADLRTPHTTMKNICTLTLCALLLAVRPVAAAENVSLVYPTTDEPSFVVDVPSDWELTKAEEQGDYFHLDGPTGAVFSMRTIPGSEDALAESMKNCLSNVGEKFDDIELGDAQDWTPSGMTGFYAVGDAKEKSSGKNVRLAFAWCALPNDQIAELWFVTDADDTQGMDQANKIVNSLQAP